MELHRYSILYRTSACANPESVQVTAPGELDEPGAAQVVALVSEESRDDIEVLALVEL